MSIRYGDFAVYLSYSSLAFLHKITMHGKNKLNSYSIYK